MAKEVFTRKEGDYLKELIYNDVSEGNYFTEEKSLRMKLVSKITELTNYDQSE